MEETPRKSYPSDVTDEEWSFVAPYLVLMCLAAPQRPHDPREVSNALRWIVRAGAPWRYLSGEFPLLEAAYQQTRRWIAAGCFETMVHDLRALLRWTKGRNDDPSAVMFDCRTVQSTPESGAQAGYDGHKRRKGSKIHLAVDTLGHLLALQVTPANEQDRAQVADLTAALQEATGAVPAEAAGANGFVLVVVQLPWATRGFVKLPRQWVVERSFAWVSRFRRLARDYERLLETVAGLHFVAFSCLMVRQLVRVIA